MDASGEQARSAFKHDVVARAVLAFAPFTTRRRLLRYASAPIAVGLSGLIQYSVFSELGIAPFVFLYVGIAVCSGISGRGPGVFCVLLSAAFGNWLFLTPYRAWSANSSALAATGLFLVAGTIVSLVCSSFRTSLLRTEVAAQEFAERGEILQLAHDAIFIWRMDGGIDLWNQGAARLYGFGAEEALGRASHDLLQTTFPVPYLEIEAALRARGRWGGELTQRAKDGSVVVVSSTMQTLQKHGDRVLEANSDITDRKRAEQALKESREALRLSDLRKSEFIGVLSHELRNPLAAIHSGLYVLGRCQPGSEQAGRASAAIERQVAQLTRLTDDLLDVTRITQGKVRLQPETLDLNELMVSTVDDHRILFQNALVDLDLVPAPVPLEINADLTRVKQMVGNLLQNAAKFTPRGGRVIVSLALRDGFAELTVKDTGVGIEADVLPHLFEPFSQARRTLDRTTGGLGLGLALVKGLAERHRGSVSAHSEGPGQGSTFVLRLPLYHPRAPVLTLVPVARSASGRRVLVIEDNADVANMLREVLELNGYQVELAFNGPDGLAKARSLQPHLILCDIGLPGMDGYTVARAIRDDAILRPIHLVALSGYGQPEDIERARQAGFDLHLTKPVDLEKLETEVAHIQSTTGT
jgi:PAS domain S-box-containing protein